MEIIWRVWAKQVATYTEHHRQGSCRYSGWMDGLDSWLYRSI